MLRRIILIILMAAALVCAAVTLPTVNKERDKLAAKTMMGKDDLSDDPTITLLTNVLGGFRGLLVDAAWLRASQLQEENKFWELYQLADWIGKLSPRLEEVWDFQLWNLAYNLTAEMNSGEARWQWLQKGVEFARDKGLKYNPESGRIMARLSWVFWHKIGKDTDNFHWYYKIRWAALMNDVFGDYDDQDIPGIHAAPDKLDVLLQDPDVSAALKDVSPAVLEQLDKVTTILITSPPRQNSIPEEIWTTFRGKPAAWAKVRNYVSRRILRDVYKMRDFDIMEGMEKSYGRFDWRMPDPHGVYWAILARQVEKKPKNILEYDRLIVFGLQESIRRGRMAYIGHIDRGPQDPQPDQQMVTLTDIRKIPKVEKVYAECFEKYPMDKTGGESWRDGHMQFLQEAMTYLYFAGYPKEAARYFDMMVDLYKDKTLEKTLDEYILGRIRVLVDEQGTTAKIIAVLDGTIMQMLYAYAYNYDDFARQQQDFARAVWEAYLHAELKRLSYGPKVENTYPTYKELERYKVLQFVLTPGLMDLKVQKVLRVKLSISETATPEATFNTFKEFSDIPAISESSPLPK